MAVYTPGRSYPPSKELDNGEILREVQEVEEDMEWGPVEERKTLFFLSTING